jgi:integrase
MQLGNLSQTALARLTHGKLTLTQAAERWFEARRVRSRSPATIATDRSVIARWFAWKPALAQTAPMGLERGDLFDFVNRPGRSGATARRRVLQVLISFVGFLADNGMIATNPAADVTVDIRALTHGQREKKVVAPFTAAEIKTILARTDGWWHWATGISAATSLRLGDVAQREHESLGVPGHIVGWTSKRLRRVCLPINPRLTPGLAALLAAIPPSDSRYVFPEQAKQYADIAAGRSKFSMQFKRLLESLGIEGRSFHSLRHTAITRWKRIGFDLDQCAEYAGHKNPETTRGYIHAQKH